VSLQVVGASVSAMPFSDGPRHEAQFAAITAGITAAANMRNKGSLCSSRVFEKNLIDGSFLLIMVPFR
jgi:hypothetical protein